MARVYAPNEDYNAKHYDVDFYNGVAIIPDIAVNTLARLEANGYTVVTGSDKLTPWDKLSNAELKEILDYFDIDGENLNKHELVKEIQFNAGRFLSIKHIEDFVDMDGGTFLEPVFADAEEIIDTLQTTVECILQNDIAVEIDIDWEDTDNYDVNTVGSYTFTGILNIPDYSTITNPDELYVDVEVVVNPINLTSVETLADIDGGLINSPNFNSFSEIVATLPQTVKCYYDEDQYIEAEVNWEDVNGYNPYAAGRQTIFGTLIIPANYTNTNNLTATVGVVINVPIQTFYINGGSNPHYISGNITNIDYPTSTDVINYITNNYLPYICFNYADIYGNYYPCEAVNYENTDNYDGTTAGTYTFTARPVLPEGYANPNDLNVAVEIEISAPALYQILSVETLTNFNLGSASEPPYYSFSYLAAGNISNPSYPNGFLPQTVQCYCSYNGMAPNYFAIPVTWQDTDNFNPEVAGSYTMTGTLTLPANYVNPDNLTATVEVVIAE